MRGDQDIYGSGSGRLAKPYHIEKNLCVGCKVCMKYCHVNAIEDKIFECAILEDICLGCGRCAERCPQHAIVR